MNNNYFGANGNYNYMGMGYQQPVEATKTKSFYSEEEYNKLVKRASSFSLNLTEEEYLRSFCNHRTLDGTGDTLIVDPTTGIVSCELCKYQFRPCDDISQEEIQEDVNRIVDILQTIKIMYVDMPVNVAKEYFQIIPLIEKIPKLFDLAAKDMAKHDNNGWRYNTQSQGALGVLSNIRDMFASGGIPNVNYDPGQNQMMGNPYMMNQNNGNVVSGNPAFTGFGYPGANSNNPAATANPGYAGGYQPTGAGFAYNPNPNASTVPTAPTTAPGASNVAPNPTQAVTVPQAKEPVKEETVTQKINL